MRLSFEDGERAALLTRLGLPDDADDAALGTRIQAWIQEPPKPETNNAADDIAAQNNAGDLPEDGDFVVIDVASFREMRKDKITASAVIEANRVRDRDELIDEAIHDGKFGPGRRDHYIARYDSDPEGTKTLIARLQKNTVPLEARGADAVTDEVDDSSYPTDWAPEVAARQGVDAQRGVVATGPVTAVPRRNRVHGEN